MKLRLLGMIGLVFASLTVGQTASASANRRVECSVRAMRAVENKFADHFFESGQRVRVIESVRCEPKVSRAGNRYYSCLVGASTGDGAGDVEYGVMLNHDCSRAFSVFVIGME